MIIKTKISLKEYVRLIYGLTYKKPIMILLVCVAMILILWILAYYLNVLPVPKPIIYQYLTLILIAFVQPIVIFITIWKNYNSSNHLRETLQMEFSDDAIKITGESFYMEVVWKRMFKIVEQANWFLIYQNSLSAIIIPKKEFKEEEIDRFREMLETVTEVPVSLK